MKTWYQEYNKRPCLNSQQHRNSSSDSTDLTCGVPQDSSIASILLNFSTKPLVNLSENTAEMLSLVFSSVFSLTHVLQRQEYPHES